MYSRILQRNIANKSLFNQVNRYLTNPIIPNENQCKIIYSKNTKIININFNIIAEHNGNTYGLLLNSKLFETLYCPGTLHDVSNDINCHIYNLYKFAKDKDRMSYNCQTNIGAVKCACSIFMSSLYCINIYTKDVANQGIDAQYFNFNSKFLNIHTDNDHHSSTYFAQMERCDYYDLLFAEKNRLNDKFYCLQYQDNTFINSVYAIRLLNHDDNVIHDDVELKEKTRINLINATIHSGHDINCKTLDIIDDYTGVFFTNVFLKENPSLSINDANSLIENWPDENNTIYFSNFAPNLVFD